MLQGVCIVFTVFVFTFPHVISSFFFFILATVVAMFCILIGDMVRSEYRHLVLQRNQEEVL